MRELVLGRPGGRAAALVLAVAACSRSPRPQGEAASGDPVVARVGGALIHTSEVARDLRSHAGLDARHALDERIVFELLAQAAEAAADKPRTEDLEALKSMEVQRLIESEIEPQLRRDAIPDADVRALYERGKRRFVHGRLVQTTVLCVFTGARMKAEPRARAERTAKDLSAYLDAHPARIPADFEALAKDPSWADRKLTVTTVWQDVERDEPFPTVLGRALAALKSPGDRTPLVGDETGYYVAMYIDDRPPERQSFAAVAAGLRDEMFEPWRRQRFLRLSMEMSAGHEIAVFPDALSPGPRTAN